MRVAIGIPPCRTPPQLATLARRAEEAGFDTVSFPDSPTLYRDTFIALAFAAAATDRVTLASWVSHLSTRDPISLASATRTVAELAPGRLRLGLGAGDSAAFLTGNPPTRTDALREGTATIRDLLAGRAATVRGTEIVLQDPCGAVPIYLAADGPRNLALAAEIADGIIVFSGEMERKRAQIDAAARRAGRGAPPFCVSVGAVRVTDDVERDARGLKPYALRYAERVGRDELESIGFNGALPDGNITLPDGSDIGHPRDLEAAAEFAGRWISDAFAAWYARTVCYFGSGEEIASRLGDLARFGVAEVQVTRGNAFETPDELIDEMGSEVNPLLHRSGEGS